MSRTEQQLIIELECQRFQVGILPHTLLLLLPLVLLCYFFGRVRRRYFYCRQFVGVFAMGRADQAHNSIFGHALDLCRVHYHLVRSVDLPMDECHSRHTLEEYRSQLPEFPRYARP